MNAKKTEQQRLILPTEEGDLYHGLLLRPFLRKLIATTMPALLEHTVRNAYLLDEIQEYLLENRNLYSELLEHQLSEELYTTLVGIKVLMGRRLGLAALEAAEESLSEQKANMRLKLKEIFGD